MMNNKNNKVRGLNHLCIQDPETMFCRIEKYENEIEELKKNLEALTPGGSEFHDNTENCFSYIKERLASVKQQVKLRKENEKENKNLKRQLDKTNRKLKKAIKLIDDVGDVYLSSICSFCGKNPESCDEEDCEQSINNFLDNEDATYNNYKIESIIINVEDLRIVRQLLKGWEDEMPSDLDPTMYLTSTYEGDLKIQKRLLNMFKKLPDKNIKKEDKGE